MSIGQAGATTLVLAGLVVGGFATAGLAYEHYMRQRAPSIDFAYWFWQSWGAIALGTLLVVLGIGVFFRERRRRSRGVSAERP